MTTMPEIDSEILVRDDHHLLEHSPAVLLNSRQSKTPVGDDPWIRRTIDACRSYIQNGNPIIASVGMNTWELVLWAIGEYKGMGIVICPAKSGESIDPIVERLTYDFDLDPENTAWLFIRMPEKARSEKAWWKARDRLALDIGRNIVPISVRENGRIDALVKSMEGKSDVNIDPGFIVKYDPEPKNHHGLVVPKSCPIFDKWYHLTHWTCRTYKPWPGERSSDFYRAIANSGSEYPRSASCTLKRILHENLLRASGGHIRNETPVVAFTSLEPVGALKLMKWRKRYVRPTFEPYGIAIFYRSAMKLGARMVIYVRNGEEIPQAGTPPELTQGYSTGDWPKEFEWRMVGDMDLSQIPDEDAYVLVPSEKEAEEFRKLTRFRVMAMGDEGILT